MAATDQHYRNQKTLDVIFSVSCGALLLSTLWMFWQDYSREFKAKVVLEAVSGEEANPVEVAEKYEVTTGQILRWAREMDISDVNLDKLATEAVTAGEAGDDDESQVVELDTDNEVFASEVSFGATPLSWKANSFSL